MSSSAVFALEGTAASGVKQRNSPIGEYSFCLVIVISNSTDMSSIRTSSLERVSKSLTKNHTIPMINEFIDNGIQNVFPDYGFINTMPNIGLIWMKCYHMLMY